MFEMNVLANHWSGSGIKKHLVQIYIFLKIHVFVATNKAGDVLKLLKNIKGLKTQSLSVVTGRQSTVCCPI